MLEENDCLKDEFVELDVVEVVDDVEDIMDTVVEDDLVEEDAEVVSKVVKP